MRSLILAILLLTLLAALTGCVVERDVVVVVTATAEPAEDTLPAATPTNTISPPPTQTPAPTQSPEPEGPTPLPEVFPTPVEAQIRVAEQIFEHGRMFWLEPTDEIWAILEDGSWEKYSNSFQEGDPENDPTLTSPAANLQQPIRGFGKVWREEPDLRDRLGWAIDIEYGYDTAYRYMHGGYVDDDGNYQAGPGVHLLTTLGGEKIRFDESNSTWSFQ
jgi:hypothetical protein